MQETGLVLATDKYSRLSCKRQQKKHQSWAKLWCFLLVG